MVQKQKSIIFDLDGTLLDITKRWYILHLDLAKKYQFKPYDQKIYVSLKRQRIQEKQIMEGKLPARILQQYLKKREALIESEYYLSFDRLKPKAVRLITRLSANHYLYLTTSRTNIRILNKQLTRMNIRKYFTKVVTGNSLKNREKKLRDIIESKPAQYFLVGDSERDYKLARNLKIKSILVCDGSRSKIFLLKLKPDAIFDKISSLNLRPLIKFP